LVKNIFIASKVMTPRILGNENKSRYEKGTAAKDTSIVS